MVTDGDGVPLGEAGNVPVAVAERNQGGATYATGFPGCDSIMDIKLGKSRMDGSEAAIRHAMINGSLLF